VVGPRAAIDRGVLEGPLEAPRGFRKLFARSTLFPKARNGEPVLSVPEDHLDDFWQQSRGWGEVRSAICRARASIPPSIAISIIRGCAGLKFYADLSVFQAGNRETIDGGMALLDDGGILLVVPMEFHAEWFWQRGRRNDENFEARAFRLIGTYPQFDIYIAPAQRDRVC